jgi:hypothetical protein
MEIMDSYLKPLFREPIAQIVRSTIFTLRNKIERRPESQFHFDGCELLDPPDSKRTFYVMRENKREPFAVGPSLPAFRRGSRRLQDRPDSPRALERYSGMDPSQDQPNSPAQVRLNGIIEPSSSHFESTIGSARRSQSR